jgi:hypothetical protein
MPSPGCQGLVIQDEHETESNATCDKMKQHGRNKLIIPSTFPMRKGGKYDLFST